jgi:hypothetical protein
MALPTQLTHDRQIWLGSVAAAINILLCWYVARTAAKVGGRS